MRGKQLSTSETDQLCLIAVEAEAAIELELGINYPPFPNGLHLGALIGFIDGLPEIQSSPAEKTIFDMRCQEVREGLQHLARERWPDGLHGKARLNSSTKPLGNLMGAIYDLCIYSLPFSPFEKHINGPGWFHACIAEMALNNGFIPILAKLYPDAERPYSANKKTEKAYLRSLVAKINAGLKPTPIEAINELGYVGCLLDVSIHAFERDNIFQKREWAAFIKCLRKYIDAVLGPKYAPLKQKNNGELYVSIGRRRGVKKVGG